MMRGLLLALLLALVAGVALGAAPLDLHDYGATLNGVASDDAAYAAAIADASSGIKGTHAICFTGTLTLYAQPPPLNRVHLWGSDAFGSLVAKRFAGGILFEFNGNSGGGLHYLSAPQDTGTPGSYTIQVLAGSSYAPDSLILEHLYLGSGTGPGPFRSIEFNGAARSIGIRQARIDDVTCFGTSGSPNVWCTNAVDLECIGFRIYPSGGTYGDIGGNPNPGFSWGPGCTSSGYWIY